MPTHKYPAFVCPPTTSFIVFTHVNFDLLPWLDSLSVQDLQSFRSEDGDDSIYDGDPEDEDLWHSFTGPLSAAALLWVARNPSQSQLCPSDAAQTVESAANGEATLYTNYKDLHDYYINRVSQNAVDSLLDGYEL